MIPVRRLLLWNAPVALSSTTTTTTESENNDNNNNVPLGNDQDEEEEFGGVYISDEENQQPINNNDQHGDDDFEEFRYMIDEDNNEETMDTLEGNIKDFPEMNDMVPSMIQQEDLVSDYFGFRLGSYLLFQKKTTQLGFPLRLILNDQEQENQSNKIQLTRENLPSFLLSEYLFDQENFQAVNNEIETHAQSLMDNYGKNLKLLSPIVHLIKEKSKMKFGWKSATSLEYSHAKFEKNQKRDVIDKAISCPETLCHQYLENLPSVFQIQKLKGPTPIEYYYNQRIVIQLHPFLCLQVKPSELRQSRHYNISQSKTSKYRGYYFYFEITILDSDFTSKYGDEAVTEVGVGLSGFRYEDGMTGWYQNSIGYHTDCGRIYLNMPENTEKNYAGRAKIGDTIGVSWSLESGDITFTRNGIVCRTATGASSWNKDFWSKEFSTFCPTISSDFEQRVFYVNMGLNRAIYPFRYYQFNTYEEQEIMFSFIDSSSHPFVDINIITRD